MQNSMCPLMSQHEDFAALVERAHRVAEEMFANDAELVAILERVAAEKDGAS